MCIVQADPSVSRQAGIFVFHGGNMQGWLELGIAMYCISGSDIDRDREKRESGLPATGPCNHIFQVLSAGGA